MGVCEFIRERDGIKGGFVTGDKCLMYKMNK